MAMSLDELLALSQEGTAQAAAEKVGTEEHPTESTTTTPTSDTPGALPAYMLSAALATHTPTRAGKAAVRAVGERTVDPLARVAMGEDTALQGVGDVLQVGTSVAMPGITAAGAGMQAIGDYLGMELDTARALGGLTEMIGSGAQFVKAGIKASRAGKAIVKEAGKVIETEAGAADLLPRERLSANLVGGIRRTMGTVRRQLKNDLNDVELSFVNETPRLEPGTPAFDKLRDGLNEARRSAAKLDGQTSTLLQKIDEMMHPADPGKPAQPIPSRYLVRLRKQLRDQMRFQNSPDPDSSATGRKAAAIRQKITDAMESGMSDDLAARWSEARTAYRTGVVEPYRALRTVLGNNVTPMQGYKAVFNSEDPNVFRTVIRLSQDSPALKGRLKLGFLETMREATGNFQDAAKMQATFQQSRPILSATGLFTAEELSSLDVMLRRRELPNMVEALASFVATPRGMIRLGIAEGIGFLLTRDPSILPIAALASGALPQLRRLTMLPRGSSEGRKLALQAVNQIVKFAQSIQTESMESPELMDTTDDG